MASLVATSRAPDGLEPLLPPPVQPARARDHVIVYRDLPAEGPFGRIVIKGEGLAVGANGALLAGTVTAVRLAGHDGKTLFRIASMEMPGDLFGWLQTMRPAAELLEAMLAGGSTLAGGASANVLRGGSGGDAISGRGGDDFIVPNAGRDRIDGGAGFDQVSWAEAAYHAVAGVGGVRLDAGRGLARDPYGDRDSFEGIEGFRLSLSADRARGSPSGDYFRPLLGEDTLDGGGGSDWVAYDDDAQFGGSQGVVVRLGRGVATDGFGTRDTLKRIENARGTAFDDQLSGGREANVLEGLAGEDTLSGRGGEDVLTGGPGADVFVFGKPRANHDILPDFVPGEDVLAFRMTRFGGEPDGPPPRLLPAGEGADGASGPVFLYDGEDGLLFFDADGAGRADAVLLAVFTEAPALSAEDLAWI